MTFDPSEFLKDKKVLIWDDSQGYRQTVFDGLKSIGMSTSNIFSTKNFREALQYVEHARPAIIISEFEVHGQFGLELSLLQKDLISDPDAKLFMLISANSEKSAVADAAEDEVDVFLVKPFTADMFAEYTLGAIKRKTQPSEYARTVKSAKKLIFEKKYDEARKILGIATLMFAKATMAFYLIGETYVLERNYKSALEQFEQGLAIDRIHFKCLMGKFNVLYDQGKKSEAYSVIKTLSANFPLTPQLLKKAFILNILSYNYKEVDAYYELYLKQSRKPDELKHTVSYALLTAGKLLLREKKFDKALNYFKHGAVITGRQSEFLEDIVKTLVKHSLVSECNTFFSMFSPGQVSEQLIRKLKFKVLLATENVSPQAIAESGKELIFEDNADQEIFDKTIAAALTAGPKNLAETLIYKAIEKFPDKQKEYKKLLS